MLRLPYPDTEAGIIIISGQDRCGLPQVSPHRAQMPGIYAGFPAFANFNADLRCRAPILHSKVLETGLALLDHTGAPQGLRKAFSALGVYDWLVRQLIAHTVLSENAL